MENEKLEMSVLKLIIYAVTIGVLVGVLELYIGHTYILNPLLYNKDLNFVYESYLAPTYYGLTKSIVVATVFFFVYFLTRKNNISQGLKSIIVGIIGTILFGIYYYFTFPRVTVLDASIIGVVHISFITVITYLSAKILKIK